MLYTDTYKLVEILRLSDCSYQEKRRLVYYVEKYFITSTQRSLARYNLFFFIKKIIYLYNVKLESIDRLLVAVNFLHLYNFFIPQFKSFFISTTV